MEQEDLHQQFLSLNEYFNHLGTQLADASDGLLNDGLLPSQKLLDELVTAREDLDRFRSRALAETQSLDLQPGPELDDIHSLRDIESLLHHIAHAEKAKEDAEVVRQYALTLVTRVRRIGHAECEHFAPLADIHNIADELLAAISNAQWSDMPPDTHALADGSHPFSTLLTLVEQQAELDDDAWGNLQDIVTQSFGRPLSVAAARGKLLLNEISETEHLSPSGNADQETVAPEEHVIDQQATVPLEDKATPISPPEETAEESPVTSQEPQDNLSPAEELAKALQRVDDRESQEGQEQATVAMPSHREGSEASPAALADIENEEEEAALSIKQEVLDSFLKEQLDAVRKDAAGRQKQGFIKNIGRRMRQ